MILPGRRTPPRPRGRPKEAANGPENGPTTGTANVESRLNSGDNGGALARQASVLSPRSMKRLYTLAEAAAYLGRSTWSIRRLIWNGELPAVRAGGRVHLDVRDMDEFIDKHKVAEV